MATNVQINVSGVILYFVFSGMDSNINYKSASDHS